MTLAAAFIAGAPPMNGAAHAQQMSPMEVSVSSYGDRFMTRLDVVNPYANQRDFRIVAYDEAGMPLELWADVAQFTLRPGALRKVMVSAPFQGQTQRKVLVCVETMVERDSGTSIRAQVCSKLKGKKL